MAGMMGGANHLGMGERPSDSHHWVPGMGWVFMPTYEEGNGASVQGAARDNNDAFQYEVDGKSVADAQASGVTSYGSAQGYSLTPEVSAKIRARQASHDWYTGGMDHYGGPVDNGHEWRAAAGDWLRERNGKPTISPWINTFDHDAENTFNRMRQDNYNAFLGSEGRWVGDDQQGIGELDGYNDNSIAAWFKDQFAGDDMVKHRREALNTLNGWNTQVRNPDYQSNMDRSERWMNGEGHGINKGTQRMTKRYFDQMDLGNKFGIEWVDPYQDQRDAVHNAITGGNTGGNTGGESTGGFMDGYLNQRKDISLGGTNPNARRVDKSGMGSGPPYGVMPDGGGYKGPLTPARPPQTGGARPSGPGDYSHLLPDEVFPTPTQPKAGGFLESYLKRKAETKPSVMSLMTELKDA